MLFIHFKTLFSFRFYHRLLGLSGKQTAGFVAYLFVLAVIVCFFFTGSVIKTHLPVFLKNFPQVTFEKGVLTAPAHPVQAPVPNTDFKVVFDASAKVPPTAQELVAQNTVAWVHGNQLYIPSGDKLQIQTLPDTFTFTSSQDVLEKYRPTLAASLRAALFITSLFFIVLVLVFDFCLALCVVLFFNIAHRAPFPKLMLLKLAAFLLGPLSALWLVYLWVPIPLFTLAQLVVCIIYTQQIFNTAKEFPHEN